MRISWNEFFMHPCVNLMNEVWGSDAGQQSSLSASYSELLRELEVREREVDHLRMYTLSLTPRVSCRVSCACAVARVSCACAIARVWCRVVLTGGAC